MEDESTALREASKAGDAACVALLLRAGGGGGIDEACPLGWTALHNAAFSGSAAVTCALLAHGADLAARTKIGATALHVASFNGRLDVCKLLVVHGADVHATDRDGITPLEDALVPHPRPMLRGGDACAAVVKERRIPRQGESGRPRKPHLRPGEPLPACAASRVRAPPRR